MQAIKFTDDEGKGIRGLAIPFGGPVYLAGKDTDGESFSANTDLCLDWFPQGRPILYHHGLDGSLKTAVVGRQVDVETEDDGAWVTGQLDKRSRYYERIKQLIDKSALSFSSGAMPHLVKTSKAGDIERWPWVELSLTPTPANPGAVVYAVKSDLESDFFFDNNAEAPGSGSFDAQAERVVSDVADLLARADARIEVRAAKAGRELSASNRTLLTSLLERLGSVDELRQEVKQTLERTDPEAQKANEDLASEVLVAELRLSGWLS